MQLQLFLMNKTVELKKQKTLNKNISLFSFMLAWEEGEEDGKIGQEVAGISEFEDTSNGPYFS